MTIDYLIDHTSDAPRRLLADPSQRVMTSADCEALFKRIVALTNGQGDTQVSIRGTWTSSLRWARNRPTSLGDTIAFTVQITRSQSGKTITSACNQLGDTALKNVVQRLERRLVAMQTNPRKSLLAPLGPQAYLAPAIWDDATFAMTPRALSEAARTSVDAVVDAKLTAAGYAEVSAATWAIFNTKGLAAHALATGALYMETVRNEAGDASGWAGKSHMAWSKLGASALSATALQKCRASAHPVRVEPGRYTTILEPKAVALLMSSATEAMDRAAAEQGGTVYSGARRHESKIGQQIFDSRITITSDPMDSDCGYIPFDPDGYPYRKVTWVEAGVLKALAYDRSYAQQYLGKDEALPNPRAFRVSGGPTTIEEMIATTERGIYVTHFHILELADQPTLSGTAVTQDGLWLIERGQIMHPIQNLWIYDSPMVIFNQVLQIGPAVRTVGIYDGGFGGHQQSLPTQVLNDGYMPVVAPSMKVKDFNFTRLSDAV